MTDLRLVVAQIEHVYPGAFDGGRIPWVHFWNLYRQLAPVVALAKLIRADAASLGVGLAWHGAPVLRQIEALERQAFPDAPPG